MESVRKPRIFHFLLSPPPLQLFINAEESWESLVVSSHCSNVDSFKEHFNSFTRILSPPISSSLSLRPSINDAPLFTKILLDNSSMEGSNRCLFEKCSHLETEEIPNFRFVVLIIDSMYILLLIPSLTFSSNLIDESWSEKNRRV